MKLNPLFGSVKGKIIRGLFGGGDEDPKKKKVFTSQAEIEAANREAKRLVAKSGADDWTVSNAYVARDVGDAKPEYVGLDGKPYAQPKIKIKSVTALPHGITIDDIYEGEGGMYYYNDPQSGNATAVDMPTIAARYGKKITPEQGKEMLASNKVRISSKTK